MLCETCGKNNSDSVTVCKHCGALLPPKASCGGFSDILSYEVKQTAEEKGNASYNENGGSFSDEAIRRLLNTEQDLQAKIRKSRKKAKSAALIAGFALVIGIAGVAMNFLYNPHAEKIAQMEKQIAELQTVLSETQLNNATSQDMPKGNLEEALNSFYSNSSEKVKQSAEKWKKAQEVVVPAVVAQPDTVSEPVPEAQTAEAGN